MHFSLVDAVIEQSPTRVVAIKNVTLAEEYLQDHFPTFHVLPGVFMLEALVQTARHLLESRGKQRWVLGDVRALRYGSFVKPGEALRMEVTVDKEFGEDGITFKGKATVCRQGQDPKDAETAVSGRFTMRPLRVAAPALPPLTVSSLTTAGA